MQAMKSELVPEPPDEDEDAESVGAEPQADRPRLRAAVRPRAMAGWDFFITVISMA